MRVTAWARSAASSNFRVPGALASMAFSTWLVSASGPTIATGRSLTLDVTAGQEKAITMTAITAARPTPMAMARRHDECCGGWAAVDMRLLKRMFVLYNAPDAI